MTVLIVIPSRDFDPSEVAISWKVLCDAGLRVRFATPDGRPGQGDPLMLSGEGLDPWGFIPLLKRVKLLGLGLRADARARRAYAQMVGSEEFQHPLKYVDVDLHDFDGLVLPGGHRAAGMRPYLESPVLQRLVASFFERDVPVGAICHGVLLAARSVSPSTGRSVLHGRKTTALTWKLEHSAWTMTRYFGRFWDPDYYRTYSETAADPPGWWSVEAEVKRVLASPVDFLLPQDWRQASGLFRDSPDDTRCAFVVRDGNYVSARWPGDAHRFAQTFASLIPSPSGRGTNAATIKPT
jgi:putative intracellular protease/amidase